MVNRPTTKESERNAIEERPKPLDGLKERESEVRRQKEEDLAIIQDENTSPPDKDTTEGSMAKINEELALLQTQIAERERARPVSERIRDLPAAQRDRQRRFLGRGATIGTMLSVIADIFKTSDAEAKVEMNQQRDES